ncbi:MAG: pilus assembly protein [Cellvibrionaceae bacterium]
MIVTQSVKVNLTSLNLVHDELVSTIEQSASKLEQFVADMENGELLQSCIEGMQQISGTLSLVQLHGADLLAKEVLALANEITVGSEGNEAKLSVLTSAFFIVPRYVEYTIQTRKGMPVLLIPTINELREARGDKPLEESYFFEVNTAAGKELMGQAGQASAVLSEDLESLVRRLRHMYQVGLLSIFKNKLIKPSLGMMQRSMERLASVSGGRPLTILWRVASVALEAMAASQMEIPKVRKQLLGAIDREIKKVQTQGQQALDQEPPRLLVKECLYLIAASGAESNAIKAIEDTYKYESLNYNDHELSREREVLRGPSATTVSSVALVLKDELRAIKDILERASQGATDAVSDYDELLNTMNKVSEILSVVGLTSPSNALKEEVAKVEEWKKNPDEADAKGMVDIADAVLYVESTIAGLESSNLSDERLLQANTIARKEVIASNQLAEAETVVLQEAESGLSLVKRALNSFADSNYDRGHIKNVGATLDSVRGGMALLGMQRACNVLASCVEFVDDTLLHNDQPAALQHLLETFADAVIGLEYYLDAVKTDRDAGDFTLEIAEESLEALGHPVNP